MTVVDVANLDDDPRFDEETKDEIRTFNRFLGLAGAAPNTRFLRDHPGWFFYVVGLYNGVDVGAPPEGWDDVAITAWTLPG